MNVATLVRPIAARQRPQVLAWLRWLMQRATGSCTVLVRELDNGATEWIAHPLGRTVRCEAGALWLTFDNDAEDVVLEAGESHRCAKASKLGIHALVAARVSVA